MAIVQRNTPEDAKIKRHRPCWTLVHFVFFRSALRNADFAQRAAVVELERIHQASRHPEVGVAFRNRIGLADWKRAAPTCGGERVHLEGGLVKQPKLAPAKDEAPRDYSARRNR